MKKYLFLNLCVLSAALFGVAMAVDSNGPLGPGGGQVVGDGGPNTTITNGPPSDCTCLYLALTACTSRVTCDTNANGGVVGPVECVTPEALCIGCCLSVLVQWGSIGSGCVRVTLRQEPADRPNFEFVTNCESAISRTRLDLNSPCTNGCTNLWVRGLRVTDTNRPSKIIAELYPCGSPVPCKIVDLPLTVVDLLAATGFPQVVPPLSNVTFTALTDPSGYEGVVRWSGGGTPATGSGKYFTTSWADEGVYVVTARCGTDASCGQTVTATATVISVDYAIDHVCTTDVHSAHVVPVTVTPNDTGVPITLRLARTSSGGSGRAIFTNSNSDVMTITTSTTVTVMGTEASSVLSNMEMRAELASGTVLLRRLFTVFDTIILTLTNEATGDSIIDVTQPHEPPADSNTLYLVEGTNGTAAMTVDFRWMPSSVTNSRFRYEICLTNDAPTSQWLPSSSGVFASNTLTLVWTNTGANCKRMFKIRAWFDCEGTGAYDPYGDTEPHRQLYVHVLSPPRLLAVTDFFTPRQQESPPYHVCKADYMPQRRTRAS